MCESPFYTLARPWGWGWGWRTSHTACGTCLGLLAVPGSGPGLPSCGAGSSQEGPQSDPPVLSVTLPQRRSHFKSHVAPRPKHCLRITVHRPVPHCVPTSLREFRGASEPSLWRVEDPWGTRPPKWAASGARRCLSIFLSTRVWCYSDSFVAIPQLKTRQNEARTQCTSRHRESGSVAGGHPERSVPPKPHASARHTVTGVVGSICLLTSTRNLGHPPRCL